jgi:hypothetical protein
MKKDSIELLHLSGTLADELIWAELYECLTEILETVNWLDSIEVLADESGKVYAGRIGSNEWIFVYRTLKSEAVFRKVMRVTMELMLSEKWN